MEKINYTDKVALNENPSVELLSEDETTVYQTIDCSNLENDKYYTINQKMEVV